MRCVEIVSGPDSRGRYMYRLCWTDSYCPGHPEGEYEIRERSQTRIGPLPEGVDVRTDERQGV